MLYYTSTSIIFLLITCIKSAEKEEIKSCPVSQVRRWKPLPPNANNRLFCILRLRIEKEAWMMQKWFYYIPPKNLLHTTIQPPLSKAIFSKDLYIYYIFRACVVHNITKQWKNKCYPKQQT